MVEDSERLDASNGGSYRPPPEFQEDERDPLIELGLSDSAELWLIQWPKDQPPDFDGQELSLKLHRDGLLGSFEGSSGKSYDMVSFAALDPGATVFISSASESKIAGKISRRVSLVHYPEPSELQKPVSSNLKQLYQRSSGASLTHSSHNYATPTQSYRSRHSKSTSSKAASTHTGRYRSSLTEVGQPPKSQKRQHLEDSTRSLDRSAQNSGQGHSTVTSSGSLQHSSEWKSKKKLK